MIILLTHICVPQPQWVNWLLAFKLTNDIILSQCPMRYIYRQFSNIRRTKYQNLNVSRLVLQLSLRNLLKPDVSGEWRCSWSSADRRCCNYIWVINNFNAWEDASYIRGLTVLEIFCIRTPDGVVTVEVSWEFTRFRRPSWMTSCGQQNVSWWPSRASFTNMDEFNPSMDK